MSTKHLAVDLRWVEDHTNVRRAVHPPLIRHEPVLIADKPWEKRGVLLYGSVMYDESLSLFRMWYKSLDYDRQARVCYATSKDGLDWDKPELGLHEFEGSAANNIVFDPPCQFDGPCLIFDDADEAAPFKMVYHLHPLPDDGPRSLHGATSPDGIHWKVCGSNPIVTEFSDRQQAMPHRDADGKFVIYARPAAWVKKYGQRVVARLTSDDFENWSEPQLIFKSLPDDPPMMEVYSLTPFACPSGVANHSKPTKAGGYLGLYERMHFRPDVLDTELLFSEDGIDWQPIYPRVPFFDRQPNSWRSHWISPSANPPIKYKNLHYWYLSGRTGAHGANHLVGEPMKTIGMASNYVDRFASWQCDAKPGWLLTKPINWPGGELLINADCRRDMTADARANYGQIDVEVQTPGGQPIEGFTRQDVKPFTWNSLGHYATIEWQNDHKLNELQGQPVQLRFYLQDANLYAIIPGGTESEFERA